MNYFLLFENFFYLYARDTTNQKLINKFTIDIINETGCIYCKLHLYYPVINGMDMLDFDYTQPIANSQTFKVEFKYSNVNFTFTPYGSVNKTVHFLLDGKEIDYKVAGKVASFLF